MVAWLTTAIGTVLINPLDQINLVNQHTGIVTLSQRECISLSFTKWLLNIYHTPGTVLGTKDTCPNRSHHVVRTQRVTIWWDTCPKKVQGSHQTDLEGRGSAIPHETWIMHMIVEVFLSGHKALHEAPRAERGHGISQEMKEILHKRGRS